jgi:arsenate reductase-like glutaredoxin family protein
MQLYGLKTCDTTRQAIKELAQSGHVVTFQDIRDQPLNRAQIERFFTLFGDKLINKASTTWREMSAADQQLSAVEMALKFPTVMKRPLIEAGEKNSLGWGKIQQEEWLG